MKGSFLGWFFGLVVLVQEIFVLPWLPLSAQVQNIFFPHNALSILLSPLPIKLDRQPCWVTCLLVCVSWHGPTT